MVEIWCWLNRFDRVELISCGVIFVCMVVLWLMVSVVCKLLFCWLVLMFFSFFRLDRVRWIFGF